MGDDWAEGSVVCVHADGFYDIKYRTVRTPQRRVPADRVRPYGRRRRGASEPNQPMDVDPPPPGSRVVVRFSDGTDYAGTIKSVTGNRALRTPTTRRCEVLLSITELVIGRTSPRRPEPWYI